MHPQIDYTFWQSIFIGASSAAGAGMVIAFPLIAQADKHQPFILSAIAGGWAGFIIGERLSLSLFEKTNRDKRSSNLEFNLPGLGALPLLAVTRTSGAEFSRPSASSFAASTPLPVANLIWKF
jgi:hypothetical protein